MDTKEAQARFQSLIRRLQGVRGAHSVMRNGSVYDVDRRTAFQLWVIETTIERLAISASQFAFAFDVPAARINGIWITSCVCTGTPAENHTYGMHITGAMTLPAAAVAHTVSFQITASMTGSTLRYELQKLNPIEAPWRVQGTIMPSDPTYGGLAGGFIASTSDSRQPASASPPSRAPHGRNQRGQLPGARERPGQRP